MENQTGNIGFHIGMIWSLTPSEAFILCQKEAVIIDVTELYHNSFKKFDVPEVIYCPFSLLKNNLEKLPAEKLIILADATGINSKKAVAICIENNFTRVANLAGGMVEWERDGFPIITDHKEKMSGPCQCQLKKRTQ